MPLLLMPPVETFVTSHLYDSIPPTSPKYRYQNEKEISGVVVEEEASPFDVIGIGPCSDANKLEWLRSQIIGGEAEFNSPFGPRRITYSDHTASGRFLQCVEDFLGREVFPFYGNTHTVDSHVGLHTSQLMHEACAYVKRRMGGGPHDVLIFCGSGSTHAIKRLQEVMGVAVPSILRSRVVDCLALHERWVVFTGPYEHHSNLLSWQQSLAQVVEIGLDEMGRLDMDSLEEALQSSEFQGRPRLGSFSACSNVTGVHTDTRAVARLLHEHGAYVCFDFACSGPYVDIQMRSGKSDGYDAVFLSAHKFLGGPGSPGILLMTDDLYRLRWAPPSTSGGGTVRYVSGYDQEFADVAAFIGKDTLYCDDVEEREDAGTPAIVQKIRAALAFRVKDYMGCALIHEREAWLMGRAMEKLEGEPRVHVLGRDSWAERHQPIISFLVYPETKTKKHLHCRFVTRLLNDLFGVQARGGCSCAGPYGHKLLGIDRARATAIRATVQLGYEGVKPGWTRVSFSYYTSDEEMEFVVEAILFVAAFGHRFVPLYNFDWKSGDWSFSVGNGYMDGHMGLVGKHRDEDEGDRCTNKYKNYMEMAKCLARALPDPPFRGKHPPEGVESQLVNFIF